eukprot:CAMPEP_0119339308 /NCGR_PEP_ID=MMETSP1333-20130426/97991_1 /TAXON_ID=418940 /ORGANISM="Scyphosphaera apsteinii, Strain RCC1455" /LENGTH=147 /DNA_ID=CAMNT_0007350803 /DNA_START=165 /DNA_END=608 /DNA_ORIENTATION=-
MACLLDAVQEGICAAGGGQTGSETATEWNPKLAHLLSSCPFEEELTKTTKNALEEEGAKVTIERTLEKRKKAIKLVCETSKGTSTECANWSDSSKALLTVQKAMFEGRTLEHDVQVGSILENGAVFQVSGIITRGVRMPVMVCCSLM